MRNYVIINGVNSLTIKGLAINILPPISKPLMRTLREEIDGRDGDLITNLGYQAYDKTLEVGLYGSYDIDEIIAFFNQEGTIVFSDENDKYYNFKILEKIDYTKLIKFRTATITLHCQPFKYPLNETPLEEEYEYVNGSGTNLTLNNTAEAIFNKIDLLGNTEQTQYTGKNLIGTNYITGVTINDTTTNDITIRGNWASTIVSNANLLNILEPSTTYTITYKYKVLERPSSFGSNNSVYILGLYDGGSGLTFFGETQKNTIALNTWDTITKTFTTPASLTNYRIIAYDFKDANNTTTGAIELNELQIEKGSSATSFEPYVGGTASPNPNYPQPIQVVSGDNEIVVESKNLLDEKGLLNATFITGTYKYTKANFKGDRVLYIRSKLKEGKSSISGLYVAISNVGSNPNVGVSKYAISNGNVSGGSTIQDFSGYEDLYVAIYPTTYTWQDVINNYDIWVCIQSDTTYSEYQGQQSYAVNLGSLELCKIGDYQDYIYKEDGSWYLHKEIGKVVLDGSETGWGNDGGGAPYKYSMSDIKNPPNNQVAEVCCNFYTPVSYGDNWNNYDYLITRPPYNSTSKGIKFKNKDISSLNDFKTWLNTHNTIVYYVLETPTINPITDEDLIAQLEATKQASSYDGQTNISQTNNDLPFVLDLSALKENSDHLVIDNIGNIYSKPTLDLEGTGIVDIYLNDTQMFEVDLSEKNEIVIDTEKMEAYNPTDNTLANRQVVGDYSKFKLDSGENDLRFSGNLTKATITNYERWL